MMADCNADVAAARPMPPARGGDRRAAGEAVRHVAEACKHGGGGCASNDAMALVAVATCVTVLVVVIQSGMVILLG